MIPPDLTDVSQESPREAIANSAMALRELARQLRDGGLVNRSLELIGVASRLERAVRQIDAAQSPPEGPWGIVGTPDAPGICYVTDSPLIARLGPLIEAEAIAVRDALNRLWAVSPTAPPAEHQGDQ